VLGGGERGTKCGVTGADDDDDYVARRRKLFDNP
jgi:hypothetical protein